MHSILLRVRVNEVAIGYMRVVWREEGMMRVALARIRRGVNIWGVDVLKEGGGE